MFSLSVHINSHQFTFLLSVLLILSLIQNSFLKFLTCLISLSDLTSSFQHQLKVSINKILTNFFLQRVRKGNSFRFFRSVTGGLRSEVKMQKNYPTKLEPLYLDKSSIYTAYVNSTFIVNVAFVLPLGMMLPVAFLCRFFYYIRDISLYSQFPGNFYHEYVLNFPKCFL